MLSLGGKLIKQRTSIIHHSLRLLYTSTFTPTQHPNPTRRNPNTARYDNLVAEAGQTRDFPRLRRLLVERINDQCFNSRDTFNFITKTQPSIDILDDLFDCLATLPGGPPRRSAFHSFVTRLCNIGLIDHALQMLDKMRQRNLELNSYSFCPVIQKLAKMRDVEKALSVLEEMKEMGIAPDVMAYNYILTAYCAKGDVGRAVEVLEKMMGEEGLKGDARMYDAMVLGACRAGKVEGGLTVLRAAIDDGVTLIHSTYVHIIKALLEEGYYAQAVTFVMCFAGRDRRLDNENFDFLAFGLIKFKRFEEAKMVVDEMIQRGLYLGQTVREFQQLHMVN